MRLVPCPGCRRHADALERACPFCGARLEPTVAAPPRKVATLTRAAIFYLGASVASVGGCSGPDEEPVVQPYGAPPEPPEDDRSIVQPYGAPIEPPPDDTTGDEDDDPQELDDESAPVPAYGGPMPPPEPPREADETSRDDASDEADEDDPAGESNHSGPAAAYGAPPIGL